MAKATWEWEPLMGWLECKMYDVASTGSRERLRGADASGAFVLSWGRATRYGAYVRVCAYLDSLGRHASKCRRCRCTVRVDG